MALYEVRFFLRTEREWSANEITNAAFDIYARMNQRGWLPKPEDRKVYVQRKYEAHEEREIVKRHAENDQAAGRNWNDAKQGCSCDLCREYRTMGASIE